MLQWLETLKGLDWKNKYLQVSINDSTSKLEEYLVEFAVNFIKEKCAELTVPSKALVECLQINWEFQFRNEFKLPVYPDDIKTMPEFVRVKISSSMLCNYKYCKK